MCQFCRQLICPPFCPNASGNDQAYGGTQCRNCGSTLSEDGFHYLSHGKPYCRECIENASPDDLVRFCETTWDEWIESMGILPAINAPKVHIGGRYES
ncbi:MAG: hypothetical protein E7680_05010 [Ruminococcaceae bacterium]|nr:hypothetical protein [Oscillospiraceae bacterium]